MVLAHSRYAGQVNAHDMFSRLRFSVLTTGLAPASFYRTGADDEPRPHYDGLPVDLVTSSIVTLTRDTPGHHTFNLVNPHDDGISLDTFVDWLIDDGHGIERLPDHGDWLTRLESALRGLPEPQRRHSALTLLHTFREPGEPVPDVPSPRFREALGHEAPRLTPALLRKYVTDLRHLTGAGAQ